MAHSSVTISCMYSNCLKTHLLVLGGVDEDFETISDCWIMNIEDQTWKEVKKLISYVGFT